MTDKPNSRRSWLWIAGIAVVVAAAVSTHRDPPAVKSADAVKADDKKFAETKGAAIGAQMVRGTMRNPDSFQLISAVVMPKGQYCYEYRAQNGFGGMNVENAVLSGPLDLKTPTSAGFITTWNRYCGNKIGRDLTEDVNALIASLPHH